MTKESVLNNSYPVDFAWIWHEFVGQEAQDFVLSGQKPCNFEP